MAVPPTYLPEAPVFAVQRLGVTRLVAPCADGVRWLDLAAVQAHACAMPDNQSFDLDLAYLSGPGAQLTSGFEPSGSTAAMEAVSRPRALGVCLGNAVGCLEAAEIVAVAHWVARLPLAGTAHVDWIWRTFAGRCPQLVVLPVLAGITELGQLENAFALAMRRALHDKTSPVRSHVRIPYRYGTPDQVPALTDERPSDEAYIKSRRMPTFEDCFFSALDRIAGSSERHGNDKTDGNAVAAMLTAMVATYVRKDWFFSHICSYSQPADADEPIAKRRDFGGLAHAMVTCDPAAPIRDTILRAMGGGTVVRAGRRLVEAQAQRVATVAAQVPCLPTVLVDLVCRLACPVDVSRGYMFPGRHDAPLTPQRQRFAQHQLVCCGDTIAIRTGTRLETVHVTLAHGSILAVELRDMATHPLSLERNIWLLSWTTEMGLDVRDFLEATGDVPDERLKKIVVERYHHAVHGWKGSMWSTEPPKVVRALVDRYGMALVLLAARFCLHACNARERVGDCGFLHGLLVCGASPEHPLLASVPWNRVRQAALLPDGAFDFWY